MAKIFLDTNWVIDIAKRRPESRLEVHNHQVFISPLSIHILCYAYKINLPDPEITNFGEEFEIVDLTDELLITSLRGPTPDLEDNIQLHSAAEAECNFFLTHDKKLLKMGFFGKTRIVNQISPHV